MATSGGGYTFIKTGDLWQLRNSEIQAMFTDRTSVLLQVTTGAGSQAYGILQQHSNYQYELQSTSC